MNEKRICRFDRGELYCGATATTLTHWSTGEQEVVYDLCDHVNMNMNMNGECSKYVRQPKYIAAWLYKYDWIGYLLVAGWLLDG